MTQPKLFLLIFLFIATPLILGLYYFYGKFQLPSTQKISRDTEIAAGDEVTMYLNSVIRIKNTTLTIEIDKFTRLPEPSVTIIMKKQEKSAEPFEHIFTTKVEASDYQTYARISLHTIFDECLLQDSKKVCASLVHKQLRNAQDCESAIGVFNVSYCKEVFGGSRKREHVIIPHHMLQHQRILHVHDYAPLEGGGIEVNTHLVCKGQSDAGNIVTLLTPYEKFRRTEPNRISALPYAAYPISKKSELQVFCHNADIINIHFTFDINTITLDAIESSLEADKKVIVSIRKPYTAIPYLPLGKKTRKYQVSYLKRLSTLLSHPNVKIIGLSHCLQDTLSWLGIKKQLQVVHNGLNDTPKPISQIEGNLSKANVSFMGNISTVKGTYQLVEAIALVTKKVPNYRARIIGYGEEFHNILKLIGKYDLKENIELIPFVNHKHIALYLKSTSLYIQPSLSEAWGNIVAEALSLSVPTITSKADGLPELMNQGAFGHLLKSVTPTEIANTLLLYYNNKKQHLHLVEKSKKAARFVRKEYSIKNQLRNLDKLYKETYA